MSRNGSGAYSLPANSWYPAVNGVSATYTDWNATAADIASALTQSVSADGQTVMSGDLNFNSSYRPKNVAAASATGHPVVYGQSAWSLAAGALTGALTATSATFSSTVAVNGALNVAQEIDVASASTTDIGGAASSAIRITGTTTITSFGTTYTGPRFLRFAGALTLTHNASSLILPNAANITTAAGDTCIAMPLPSSAGWYVMAYQRAAQTPMFSAYQSAAQGVTANVIAKVSLQTEEFDLTSAFDSATNYRFQPTTAGYYLVSGAVRATATSQMLATIYKNGSEFKRGNNIVSSGGATVTALVSMNGSTDYLELWAQSDTTQNLSASAAGTYFQGYLVKAA